VHGKEIILKNLELNHKIVVWGGGGGVTGVCSAAVSPKTILADLMMAV
jgi:hypothetical protein